MNKQFVILLFVLLGVRVAISGFDIPSVRITEHTETDQYYYGLPATNMATYSSWYSPYPPGEENLRILFDVFLNIWTLPFLWIFGLSFFSFKLPAILLSLLALWLFYKVVQRHLSNEVAAILTGFFGLEFMFLVTSTVQNPTVYSVFVSVIAMWLIHRWLQSDNNSRDSFWLGVFSMAIVLLVYVFNAYLAAAIGAFILVRSIMEHRYKSVLLYAGGAGAGLLLCTFITWILFDKTIFDLYANLETFSGGGQLRVADQLEVPLVTKIKTLIGGFFLINVFRFNLFLIPVFILTLVWSVLRFRSSGWALFYLMLFIMVDVQTFFEPLHAQKKLTVLLPFFLHGGYLSIRDLIQNSASRRASFIVLSALVVGLLFGLYSWNITTSDWYEAERWGGNTPTWFNMINVIVLFIAVAIFALRWQWNWFRQWTLFLLLIPSLSLTWYYYGLNGTSKMRSMELSEDIKANPAMAGDYVETLAIHGASPAFPSYLTNNLGEDGYESALIDSVESGSVQSLCFIRNKAFKQGYDFESRMMNDEVRDIGDLMLETTSKTVLVDQIVEISQGKELYLGVVRDR